MGNLFKRINDVVTANINDLIDRVEDPEKMIKQIIREMEENLGRAKEGVVDAVASEKKLQQDVDSNRSRSAEWQEKARAALKTGDEALARAALGRKQEHDRVLQSLEPALDSATKTSAALKDQLRALEAKLDEAKRKRSALVARQRAAEASHGMTKLGATFEQGLVAHADFTRMEDRVADLEARAEAVNEVYADDSVDRQFHDLQTEQEVDAELQALKRELDEAGA